MSESETPSEPEVIRGVVFDLDGLMFNTEQVFHLAGDELLKPRGHRMTRDLLSRMMGRRANESFAFMVEELGLTESVDDLLAESRELFEAMLATELRPMPGVFELLDLVERLGLPKAVATSSSRPYLENILGKFDLLSRFEFFLTSNDVTHGKPHPEIYQTAAQKLGHPTTELIVFEDSETGSRAAAAAETFVVAVPHEYSRDHNFSHVSYLANTLQDPYIADILNRKAATP